VFFVPDAVLFDDPFVAMSIYPLVSGDPAAALHVSCHEIRYRTQRKLLSDGWTGALWHHAAHAIGAPKPVAPADHRGRQTRAERDVRLRRVPRPAGEGDPRGARGPRRARADADRRRKVAVL